MQKQNVILSSLTGLYLIAGLSLPSSADDVYVDLSVLNTLRGGEEFVIDTAPLFPDVKNAPKPIKKAQNRKPKKVVAKKKAEQPKKEVVVEVKPVSSQEAAPVVEVKARPLAEVVKEVSPDLSSESAQVASQPVVEDVFVEAKKQAENRIMEQDANVEEQSEKTQQIQETPQLIVPVAEPTVEAEKIVEAITPENTPSTVPVGDNQIIFIDGADELTAEHKRKLDVIIAGFSNPNENTIAINSYNYDDGTDVFNKKRLSLRRIVAVRSYLLSRGYKKFTPKVINLTDDIAKSNIVELEEIKN